GDRKLTLCLEGAWPGCRPGSRMGNYAETSLQLLGRIAGSGPFAVRPETRQQRQPRGAGYAACCLPRVRVAVEAAVPDLVEIFALQEGVVSMILRGTVIYWTVLILLRIAGRREIGSLGTPDLLVLVMVADAAGGALAGNSTSVGDGVVVVAT